MNCVEHFHYYLFGKPFEVHTDQQPLVQLSIKPFAELSPRLQHSFLRVNQYKYIVIYVMTFQDGKLQDIHHQTLLDPQLVKLARVIQNGWGESHRELDADLHTFWIQIQHAYCKQHHYEWFKNHRSKVLTTRVPPMPSYGTFRH